MNSTLYTLFDVDPREVAEGMRSRVPNATAEEVVIACNALFGREAFVTSRVLVSWRMQEYEQRTGNPF